MKQNPFGTLLAGVLLIAVLGTSLLVFTYVRYVGESRKLQYQATVIQRNRSVANALASDAVQYSRKNPAIIPVLESVGINAGQSAPNPQLE